MYEEQLRGLKNLLPNAKNILIALPPSVDIDKLSSGLSLMLSLTQAGKQIAVVCEDTIRVGQAHLFGIDKVQQTIPQVGGGGNLTITLEGVASTDGTIPSLEKLDWFAENNNLNLVFHVVPGQSFQPTNIVPKTQGSSYDLIFVLGAKNLTDLGSVYSQNQQAVSSGNQNVFSRSQLVNVDNQQGNSNFGQTNVVDPNAPSISEMTTGIMTSLGLSLDADTASNLLSGIFEATNNLTGQNINANTFMAVAELLRAGGKKPEVTGFQPQPAPPTESAPAQSGGFDLSALIPRPAPTQSESGNQTEQPPSDTFVNPPVVGGPTFNPQPSAEERPQGERVVGESEAEPDWLTPKIYKGGAG